MRSAIFALVASASLAASQATLNPSTGTFTCAIPGGDYCAGDSLQTNIIIRCINGTGYPGNCNDNLAGVPPVGVKSFAPCWQTSPTSGDAACSYNGTVYGLNGTFPVPTTSATGSASTTASATASASGSGSGSGSASASASATATASSSTGTPTTVVTTTTTPSVTPVTLTTTAQTTAATTSQGSTSGSGSGSISLAQGAGTVAKEVSGWLVALMGVVAWAL